jgi:hypothetical protein
LTPTLSATGNSTAALVAPTFITTSIFEAEIDLWKEGACLCEIGSEALPYIYSGHGRGIHVFIIALKNLAKKCYCTKTILEVMIGSETFNNLLKDYGRIPMMLLSSCCWMLSNNFASIARIILQPLSLKRAPPSIAP